MLTDNCQNALFAIIFKITMAYSKKSVWHERRRPFGNTNNSIKRLNFSPKAPTQIILRVLKMSLDMFKIFLKRMNN